MTFKTLLSAVAITALSASAANALSINNITPAGIIPALELELPITTANTYTFDLDVDSGNYPNGNNVLVNVTLPSGVVFTSAVDSTTVTGASAVVQTGGAIGDGFVNYLISITTPGLSTPNFSVDLGMNACPAPGDVLRVTANIDGSGTPIESGEAVSSTLIAPCQSALTPSLAVPDVGNTQISLASGYTDLAEVGGPLFAEVNPLGEFNYAVDPTVSLSLATLTPMTSANIASITHDLVFEDGSFVGDEGFAITGSGFTFLLVFPPAPNVYTQTLVVNPATLDGVPDRIIIAASGLSQIPTQMVRLDNAVVTFQDTPGIDLIPSEPGSMGVLDMLQREGQAFGVFDWNGQNAPGTISIYRVTRLTGPTPYTVTLTNAGAANGTYSGIATPNADGELVLTSADFGLTVPPVYTRADVQIIFETLDTVDMDRLMVRNDIVSDFGGGANIDLASTVGQPTGDSDTGAAE